MAAAVPCFLFSVCIVVWNVGAIRESPLQQWGTGALRPLQYKRTALGIGFLFAADTCPAVKDELAVHTLGIGDIELDRIVVSTLPLDRDLTHRAFVVRFSMGKVGDKVRGDIGAGEVVCIGVVVDTADTLDEPCADVAEEVVVAGVDALILAGEVLGQCRFAADNERAVGRIGLVGDDLICQIGIAKRGQHVEDNARAENAGIEMIVLLVNLIKEHLVCGGLFLFCEDVFGDGQEMLILVTELTISYYGAHFISRYGCKEYFNHNKELLFYERQKEIIRQIEDFDL